MQASRQKNGRLAKGFTLIEAALATSIVGVGIVALVSSLGAGSRVNGTGRDITQAVFLAQEIREWTIKLPFLDPTEGTVDDPPGPNEADPLVSADDLNDLMDVTFPYPRNAEGVEIRDESGQRLVDLAGWTQTVHMEWRDPLSLNTTVPPGTSDIVHVTVTVSHHGREVLQTSWLVTDRPSQSSS